MIEPQLRLLDRWIDTKGDDIFCIEFPPANPNRSGRSLSVDFACWWVSPAAVLLGAVLDTMARRVEVYDIPLMLLGNLCEALKLNPKRFPMTNRDKVIQPGRILLDEGLTPAYGPALHGSFFRTKAPLHRLIAVCQGYLAM
jgi:hypothetical protein